MLPIMSGVARLTADPDLKFAPSGVAVARINLAFNSRKRQDDGSWVDDKVFFVKATAFKQLAESAAETLTKGTEVVVTGRLETEQWEDRDGGGKRSAPALLLDSIGPNLAFATATVNKVSRDGAGQPAQQSGPPADDPWGSAPPAGQPEEVPF